jgi:hypothetical protein
VQTFELASMCRVIRILTVVVLAIPIVFVLAAFPRGGLVSLPGVMLFAIYVWIWLRFRPTRFVMRDDALEVIWPLKRLAIPRRDIVAVRLVGRDELRRETGRAVRVGAGGLWGGFGWLWTAKRGIVQMYISRLDGFVWIERANVRPWLITPERPEEFVRAFGS